MTTTIRRLKTIGLELRFPHRDQLRREVRPRQCQIPTWLHRLGAKLPTPPPFQDWTKGGTLKAPILGNQKAGDCEEAAAMHGVGCWTGNVGTETVYTQQQALDLYGAITGYDPATGAGDDGTDTTSLMDYWQTTGLPGDQIILDDLAIDPNDLPAQRLASWAWGGLFTTLALFQQWIDTVAPNFVWAPVPGQKCDPALGHAIWQPGYQARGGWAWTWGLTGMLTQEGLVAAEPECTACFSPAWFNAAGMSPCGLTWDQSAALWQQIGGRELPSWEEWRDGGMAAGLRESGPMPRSSTPPASPTTTPPTTTDTDTIRQGQYTCSGALAWSGQVDLSGNTEVTTSTLMALIGNLLAGLSRRK